MFSKSEAKTVVRRVTEWAAARIQRGTSIGVSCADGAACRGVATQEASG